MLHGDVGFGAEQQFENEARMALRLANFLSAFLQVVHLIQVVRYAHGQYFENFYNIYSQRAFVLGC